MEEVIAFIKQTQKTALRSKNQQINTEIEAINSAKPESNPEQNTPESTGVEPRKSKDEMALSMQMDYDDLFEEEALQHSKIVVELDGQVDKKTDRRGIGRKFHYRRTMYDIVFAGTVTDEILNLEPIEDKLVYLREKYNLSTWQVFAQMKLKLTFFSVYNLFDTVHQNYLDLSSYIQRILLYQKKHENEIEYLR